MSKLGKLRRLGAMIALVSLVFVLLSTQHGTKSTAIAGTDVPSYSSIEVIQTVTAWTVLNNSFDSTAVTARTGILFQLGEYTDWVTKKGEGFAFDFFSIDGKQIPNQNEKLWVNVYSPLGPSNSQPISLSGAHELLPTSKKGKKCYMKPKGECCTRKLHPLLDPQAILTYWPGVSLYTDSPTQPIHDHPYIITHHFTLKDPVRVDVYKLRGGVDFARVDSFPLGVHSIKVEFRETKVTLDSEDKIILRPVKHGLSDDPPWP